ncbi:MAG: DUF222 domain-containing protein [Acidimicrobiales bacterium]
MGSVRSIHDAFGQVVELLAEVNEHDLTELVDAEVPEVALLAGRVAKLAEATHVRAAGRLDTSGAWRDDGARSASGWVAWKGSLPSGRAKALVRCARQLRSMPATEAAMAAGHLTVDHVRLLARAQRADADAFAMDEERLAAKAQRLLFSGFEKVIRYWTQVHAPDDAEADAEQLHDQRRVDASRSFEGVIFVDAMLDPITGEIWLRELERLEQEAFEADWAEARARLGDAATATDLQRTPKQRRADAMRVMAERSAAKPVDATEPRVLLHVVAGDESVKRMCELSNGTVVTPGQVLPLLRWADVARVIFDGPSRVLDVGVRQRLFTGATRIAVECRDQTCQHPGCDVPAERCEIDHIEPFDEGGLTVQANGRCYCPFHHRWHHQRQQRQPQPVA